MKNPEDACDQETGGNEDHQRFRHDWPPSPVAIPKKSLRNHFLETDLIAARN
jgi:hypothetical protein